MKCGEGCAEISCPEIWWGVEGMSRLCVIYGNKPLISETFIAAQLEQLSGEKRVLHHWYPEYTYEGRTLRYFYSQRPTLQKLQRLLPVFLYDRVVKVKERTFERTLDFMGGFFRDHGIDCIFAEYGTNGADITPVAKALGIPLLVHFHGHDAHRGETVAAYRDRYSAMFEYTTAVVSVSKAMTRSLLTLGAPEEKVVYNPYGVRERFFEVTPDYRKTLLAVGRFADIKSPALTLESFRMALGEVPDAKLVMVGDGPLLECCKALTLAWGISDSVEFKGALTQDQFVPLMSQACAFVQHSVTTSCGDSEGTPNSVLEAQAAGLPVISTRHAGIAEAVLDGDTGLLCEEYDTRSMAAAMVQFLSTPEFAREAGEAGRVHMKKAYTMSRYIGTLESLIASARRGRVGAP